MSITEFVLKSNFISLNVITMNCTALFLVHTIGQRVTTAAGNIAEAVYNLNWFEADVSTRKNILILLCMSQKPLVLGAPLFGPYSHTAAVKVLSLIMDRWLQPGCSKRKVNEIERTATYEIIEDETSSKPVNKKARKTRKYDKEYLKLGFSWSGDEKQPIPLCVICFKNLTNEKHLDGLQEGLKNYFPDLTTNLEWIRQPFNIDSSAMPDNLSNVEQEQLLELSANEFLKNKHKECSLASFWLQMQQLYPNLTEKVLKHVLPFSTSYLCEVAFSALVDIKSKKRNRILDVEPHLRLKLTNREPDYNHLASSQHKQIHPSH
nr:zinc finger BED domain-containing protein 5-like [Onthophagus taurus]